MLIKPFDKNKHIKDVQSFWYDLHWLADKNDLSVLRHFLTGSHAFVGELDDSAQALTMWTSGTFNYLTQVLPLAAITAVTTSPLARQQGIALTLTAHTLADAKAQGHAISVLHIFDQGFYDKLGFGSGGYDHWFEFDPSRLKVSSKARPAKKLTFSHYQAMHHAMLRMPGKHGACKLTPPELLLAEMNWLEHSLGLGYFNEHHELTHFFYGSSEGEYGPFEIPFMVYQSSEQLLELLALLKGLSDQFYTVRLREPSHIQLQDLLSRPLRHSELIGHNGKYRQQCISQAYWQVRILDLDQCINRTHLAITPIRFNVQLCDPITELLPDQSAWQGLSGDYILTLGPQSSIEKGQDSSLDTIKASIGAFTRLWLGVRPASGLAITDDLTTSDATLTELDRIFCLPKPNPGWEF